MQVLLVSGQNHKGSTYHLARMLAEKLTDPQQIKEVFLPRDLPEFCVGCNQCFEKDKTLCPHYTYLKPINQMMDAADVLILASPVYVYHVTGSMKAFLDHYGYQWMVHRPNGKMFQKQGVCISTAAGAGMRSTCRDLKDSLFFWGVGRIFTYGKAVYAVSWASIPEKKRQKMEADLERLAVRIRARNGRVRPGLRTRLFFTGMRCLHKRDMLGARDAAYWKQQGWLDGKVPWKDKAKEI